MLYVYPHRERIGDWTGNRGRDATAACTLILWAGPSGRGAGLSAWARHRPGAEEGHFQLLLTIGLRAGLEHRLARGQGTEGPPGYSNCSNERTRSYIPSGEAAARASSQDSSLRSSSAVRGPPGPWGHRSVRSPVCCPRWGPRSWSFAGAPRSCACGHISFSWTCFL